MPSQDTVTPSKPGATSRQRRGNSPGTRSKQPTARRFCSRKKPREIAGSSACWLNDADKSEKPDVRDSEPSFITPHGLEVERSTVSWWRHAVSFPNGSCLWKLLTFGTDDQMERSCLQNSRGRRNLWATSLAMSIRVGFEPTKSYSCCPTSSRTCASMHRQMTVVTSRVPARR